MKLIKNKTINNKKNNDFNVIVLFYLYKNIYKSFNKSIEVQNIKVSVTNVNEKDYICISDFTKYKNGKSTSDDIIRNWLRNRITIEFLGTWESIYNTNFNTVEFDGFRKYAGLHTFTLSVTEWCEKTNAIGYILNEANTEVHMLIKILHLNLHQQLVLFLSYI